MSANVCSTANYTFCTKHLIGSGATGRVYKARHKESFKKYAVKVFSTTASSVMTRTQKREFDILRRLDHPNIVKFIALEQDQVTNHHVLVMEYCNGVNLHELLSEAKNSYGVSEEEFLDILYDLADALKKLRESGVIHRDIKPGNIMSSKTQSGRIVYKLIDFGASRELREDETFKSGYGTEEYLHPDIYQMAVLREQSERQFTVASDIWSLGITLFHIASGRLPFKPFGGRQNKEMMYHLISRKEHGVISGVQLEENGEIHYSTSLPKECRLSRGAKELVTPIIAGLLEIQKDAKQWSFQQFFDAVSDIRNKLTFHVFVSVNSSMETLFVSKTCKFKDIKKIMKEWTHIPLENQLYVSAHSSIKSFEEKQPITNIFPTSVTEPLCLIDNKRYQYPKGEKLLSVALPTVDTHHLDREMDLHVAKKCHAAFIYTLNVVKHSQRIVSSNHRTITYFQNYLVDIVMEIRTQMSACGLFFREHTKHLSSVREIVKMSSKILQQQLKFISDPNLQLTSILGTMKNLENNGNILTKKNGELTKEYESLLDKIKKYQHTFLNDEFVFLKWQDTWKKLNTEKEIVEWICELENIVEECEEIFKEFRADKKSRNWSEASRQLHLFNRENLQKFCHVTNDIKGRHSTLISVVHKEAGSYIGSYALRYYEDIYSVKTSLNAFTDKINKSGTQLIEIRTKFQDGLQVIFNVWKTREQNKKGSSKISGGGSISDSGIGSSIKAHINKSFEVKPPPILQHTVPTPKLQHTVPPPMLPHTGPSLISSHTSSLMPSQNSISLDSFDQEMKNIAEEIEGNLPSIFDTVDSMQDYIRTFMLEQKSISSMPVEDDSLTESCSD